MDTTVNFRPALASLPRLNSSRISKFALLLREDGYADVASNLNFVVGIISLGTFSYSVLMPLDFDAVCVEEGRFPKL